MSATGRGALRERDDFYATPAWATKAILSHLLTPPTTQYVKPSMVLDPCAGEGAILKVCREAGYLTKGIELDPQRADECATVASEGCLAADALADSLPWWGDLVVTNPPYRLALEFIKSYLLWAEGKKEGAFLLRLNFLGSQKRASFFKQHPPDVYVLPKRPSFTEDGGTDACEYAWFLWGPNRGNRWKILDL